VKFETFANKIGPRKQGKCIAGVDYKQLNVFSWNFKTTNRENISPGVDYKQL
jgi:hypothetical protein